MGMEAHIQAAVDIHDATLRYAEVEHSGSGFRLLKLGSCEFDFDIMRELTNGASPAYLETMSDALADVFAETEASDLHVVLHPLNCYSFFTPLLVELSEDERKERLQEEATLLTTADGPLPLHLTADVVHTETLESGKTVEWFHVLGLKERVHDRFDRILRALPHDRYRFNLSTQSVARVIDSLQPANRGVPSHTLALGFYDTHVEYTVCRQQRWHFSHHAETASSSDAVFFALALLKQLNVARASVQSVFVYGARYSKEAVDLLGEVFSVSPFILNPIDVVELEGRRPGEGFSAEAYAPCIGATL